MTSPASAGVLLALASAAPALAAAPATPRAKPSLASVRVVGCSLETRSVLFYARMRRVRGTRRMSMRLTLLERAGGSGFRRVRAPGLGRWRRSKPGVRVFGYRQAVRGLVEGATYRMLVDYRWQGKRKRVLRRARRRSGACRQFVALPNLGVRIVRSQVVAPGVVRYRVRVANDGFAAARNVAVALSVDGGLANIEWIWQLRIGEQRTLSIHGPACASSVKATVDPDATISEADEGDNEHVVLCGPEDG